MSPPLVVAFALAGRVDIDLSCEPLGKDKDGAPVYLADLWPTLQEVRDAMQSALKPEVFRKLYKNFAAQNPKWNEIPRPSATCMSGTRKSTYIQEPPFFDELLDAARQHQAHHRRARAGHFRRLGDDRPHFARRRDQEIFARRKISHRERRDGGGFQQLRLAARQRPHHDAWHVRQCPHQEPDAARRRRRRDKISRQRGRLARKFIEEPMSIYDASMEYQANAARRSS